jgi:hypothetical protein
MKNCSLARIDECPHSRGKQSLENSQGGNNPSVEWHNCKKGHLSLECPEDTAYWVRKAPADERSTLGR